MIRARIKSACCRNGTFILTACAAALFLVCLGPASADDKFGRAFEQKKKVESQNRTAAQIVQDRIEEERIANEPIAPFVVTVTKTRTPDFRDSSYTDSIQKAINMVAHGGRIVIEPGDYTENIYITHAVTLVGLRGNGKVRVFPKLADQSCLTVRAAENQHAFISNIEFYVDKYMSSDAGAGSYSSGFSGEELYDDFVAGGKLANTTARSAQQSKASIPCIDVHSGILTLTESRVQGFWDDGKGNSNLHQGPMVRISGGSATLQDNSISGGRYGVSVEHRDASLRATFLIDNEITSNDRIGINLAGRATMRATGNTIMGNGNGIIYNGEGAATILANKIMENDQDGVVLGNQDLGYSRAKQALVRLNRIHENHGTGVRVYSSGGAIEDNFLVGNGRDKNGNFIRRSKQIEFNTDINGIVPKIDNNWINNKKPKNWR